MTYREPIEVRTRAEAAVSRAWTNAQVIMLLVIVGWCYVFAWNIVTACGFRRWFRKLGFTAASWAGGYVIGLGFGFYWIVRENHPELCGLAPVVAIVTLVLLRIETISYRKAQWQAYYDQLSQEHESESQENE